MLVLRVETKTGSHFRKVRCEGNRQHLLRTHALHLDMLNAEEGGGSFSVESVGFSATLNPSILMPLLKKMRPKDASYTLRVTGKHGRPLLDYVFKKGQLVRIYHHVYKQDKQGKPISGKH